MTPKPPEPPETPEIPGTSSGPDSSGRLFGPGGPPDGVPPGYHFRADWEVTPRQVKRMLDAGEDLALIDCRTEEEHTLVRIAGATLAPLQEVAARLDELQELAGRKVVVFCHHGIRSLQMTAILRQQGLADVWSMAGGIDLWASDVERGMERY